MLMMIELLDYSDFYSYAFTNFLQLARIIYIQ